MKERSMWSAILMRLHTVSVLTWEQLSDLFGVAGVNKWANGDTSPRETTRLKLSENLGVPADVIKAWCNMPDPNDDEAVDREIVHYNLYEKLGIFPVGRIETDKADKTSETTVIVRPMSEEEKAMLIDQVKAGLKKPRIKLTFAGECVVLSLMSFVLWALGYAYNPAAVQLYPALTLLSLTAGCIIVNRIVWLVAPCFARTRVYRFLDRGLDSLFVEV